MGDTKGVVLPGEVVLEDCEGFMCGSGVMKRGDQIVATVRGHVQQISKLVTVVPITSVYTPHVGDIIVGRVESVEHQRWKIQIGCSVLASLKLQAVYLPDGEMRRRTTSDERNMRKYFDIGDLVCAEVQGTEGRSSISLHTRQQHPKKLDRGIAIEVPSHTIKRSPSHIVVLEVGNPAAKFNAIFGMNGTIWLAPDPDTADISLPLMPRIRSCIILMATHNQMIASDTLCDVFDKTLGIDPDEICSHDTAVLLGFVSK